MLALLALCAASSPPLQAAEHVTLKNGFELDCSHRATVGDKVRLYFTATRPQSSESASASEEGSYLEVPATSIVHIEKIPDPLPATLPPAAPHAPASAQRTSLTPPELHQILATAGTAHNIDEDLLASVVHAESNGQIHAVSRTGAQGLMQLMPHTAADLGVKDSFAPEQNIAGGTQYLDALLTRYHDNIALAVAAYNAGPAAVDRYHGVPPYRETRAYVARVIHEFNRRKQAALIAKTP